MQRFLNSAMATWVGTFTSNLNKESIRELIVEAEDEVQAIVKLDFYDYDETWEHYSLVDIHKQNALTFVRAFQRVISAFANLKQQTTNNKQQTTTLERKHNLV